MSASAKKGPTRRPAERKTRARSYTRADLEGFPPHMTVEIIEGERSVQPRPRARHQNAGSVIGSDLNGPYQRGRGGPGGWWILDEPGIQLPESPEVAPDLAGWRVERLPRPPDDGPIRVVPDWVCEILSPSTRQWDLTTKKPFYARVGVQWLWLVDVDSRFLTVHRNLDGKWLEEATFGAEAIEASAEPFVEVKVDLASIWALAPALPTE